MYVGTLSVEILLGDIRSLKQKRGVVRPIVAELHRRYSVTVAEVGYQNLHRRSRVGMAVVAADARHCVEVLDACERLVAGRPEIELLSARRQMHKEDDDSGLRNAREKGSATMSAERRADERAQRSAEPARPPAEPARRGARP